MAHNKNFFRKNLVFKYELLEIIADISSYDIERFIQRPYVIFSKSDVQYKIVNSFDALCHAEKELNSLGYECFESPEDNIFHIIEYAIILNVYTLYGELVYSSEILRRSDINIHNHQRIDVNA